MKNDVIVILASNNRNKVWDLGHTIRDIMLGKAYEIPKKSVYQVLRKKAQTDVNKAIDSYYQLKKTSENKILYNHTPSQWNDTALIKPFTHEMELELRIPGGKIKNRMKRQKDISWAVLLKL